MGGRKALQSLAQQWLLRCILDKGKTYQPAHLKYVNFKVHKLYINKGEPMCVFVLVVCVYTTHITYNVRSHSVVSDCLRPHGLWPARVLCPWDSPGKNIGVGCHALLQEIFLTQGLNSGPLHCRWILYHLMQQEAHTIHRVAKESDTTQGLSISILRLLYSFINMKQILPYFCLELC